MAEVLFVLLTVYVVYVVQNVISNRGIKKSTAPEKVKPEVVVAEVVTKKEVVEKVKPAAKKAPVKKVVAAKTAQKVKAKKATAAKSASGSLRNPETGDVDKIANSYRMTKRWIKEALVAEGLLPKVYKTAEVDDAAKVKIEKALTKIAKMDKYQ